MQVTERDRLRGVGVKQGEIKVKKYKEEEETRARVSLQSLLSSSSPLSSPKKMMLP